MNDLDILYFEAFRDKNVLNKNEIKKAVKERKIKKVISKIKKLPINKKVVMAIALCGVILLLIKKIVDPRGLRLTVKKIEKIEEDLIKYKKKIRETNLSKEEENEFNERIDRHIDELDKIVDNIENVDFNPFAKLMSKEEIKNIKKSTLSKAQSFKNDIKSEYHYKKLSSD